MADQSHLLLVHDVLDAQLVDRREQRIGRVDELLLDISGSGPPRVSAVVIGGTPRAARVGKWALALRNSIGRLLRHTHDPVSRVTFDHVMCIGDTIQLDVDGDTLESAQREVWLRDHIICRIPGGSGGEKK